MMGAAFSRVSQGISDANAMTTQATYDNFAEVYEGETVQTYMDHIRRVLDLSPPESTQTDGEEET